MRLITTVDEMRGACLGARRNALLGVVPTMGALHDGHMSLVRAAKATCGVVAVSIFVNPTQFGPNEDLEKYPRTFERDRELLERENVDLLFAPAVGEMYLGDASTWVTVEGLSGRLDGRSRPGHFRGVTTVVAKLLNVLQPGMAFFGQKDAAQIAIIRRMVRDLFLPVEIVACPIVREPDGLALSSRNQYLTKVQRRQALVLHRALLRIKRLFDEGERKAARLIAAAREEFLQESSVQLDYCEIVDAETLEALEDVSPGGLAAVAAYVGGTRLIDNLLLPAPL